MAGAGSGRERLELRRLFISIRKVAPRPQHNAALVDACSISKNNPYLPRLMSGAKESPFT